MLLNLDHMSPTASVSLQSLQQGSKSCTEYLTLAKQWADQLAVVGKPVKDDDLISFIISGLNPMFKSFIIAFFFTIRDHEMTFTDFCSELLSHEILLHNQQQQTLTPEVGSFALHVNQPNQPKFPNKPRSCKVLSKTKLTWATLFSKAQLVYTKS